MTVISLGAGVQSSTMFLMSCLGELPKPNVAIFADTKGEPKHVYEYLDWLKIMGHRYGIPVHVVSRGDLRQDTLDYISGKSQRASSIPAFVKTGDTNREGRMWRQCTKDYKIMAVRDEVRRLLKENPEYEKPVEMWIGISTDEIVRMKDSNVKYINHRWPLIEKGMSRTDCLDWYKDHEFPEPARSACTFCPYRKNAEWAEMKNSDPESFAEAVEFDRAIRNQPKLNGEAFLHRSLVPLEDIDFDDDLSLLQFLDPGFGEECEGMCGI